MADIVAKEVGAVESVKAVCADYIFRIKDLGKFIQDADALCESEREKQEWLADARKLFYGILTELQDETRLPPKKQAALIKRLHKTSTACSPGIPLFIDGSAYGHDPIVAFYVSSRMSMRKIAFELGIDVSTVSRHVRKWAEENAEQRGGVATAREVELARLDEMLAKENARKGGGDLKNKLQILDRKYRLLGLSSSSPKVVVGIGVQQAKQPRVIEGVAHDITEDTDGIRQIPD